MNCERAMELLAIGNALGRLRARGHAARCPKCAAEAAKLARIADVLFAVEPLTAAQRALWKGAITEPRPRAARPSWPGHVRLAATAAVFVLGVGLALVALWPSPVKPLVEAPGLPVAKAEKPRRQVSPELMQELDALTSDLHALSQELAQLSRQAELLDERRDAAALTRRSVAMNSP